MKYFAKLAPFITLAISVSAIVLGFLWLQEKSLQEIESNLEQTNKQISQLLYQTSLSKINDLEKQIIAIATSPDIYSLLMRNDDNEIFTKQQTLKTLFPDALGICLIAAEVNDTVEHSCTPITFSTLNSLRQAKKLGLAPMGLMKKEKKDAHVLIAHRIMNKDEHIAGVLLVMLKPHVIDSIFLTPASDFQSYIELRQGETTPVILSSRGDISRKSGDANFVDPLPNTYWTLAYWSKQTPQVGIPYVEVALILVIVILMWFLRGLFFTSLLKRDSEILMAQIADLKANALKPDYGLSFDTTQSVASEIKILGLEFMEEMKRKKGATAETINKINKKIKEREVDKPDALDALQEMPEVEKNDIPEMEETEISVVVGVDLDPSLFKANDIRGIAGENLDVDTVTLIGQAIGSEVISKGQNALVVGRDGRLSSESLSEALIEGVLASGCNVTDVGELPTPTFYFACKNLMISSGVMVTGSHNPPEYNGLKVSVAGKTLFGKKLKGIYQRIQDDHLLEGKGTRDREDIRKDYISKVVQDINLARPMKIVIDCGNGIAGMIAPLLFKELGCDVVSLYCDVDGTFPNHHPNPSDPKNLQDLATVVKAQGAELGLAFDGDGDRLGVVDAHGNPVWPDRLMMLFSQDVLSKKPGSSIVYDVKCSSLLGSEITASGGIPIMEQSGYAFIKSKMQEVNAPLAGELSGHLFFSDRWYGFDDGLYAASRLLELITTDASQRKASDVFTTLPNRESTEELFVALDRSDDALKLIEKLITSQFDGGKVITIDGVRVEYPYGWGLARSSNTMSGLSLRFEANSREELSNIQQVFKQKLLQISPTLTLPF